jgi:hypothetical protein
VGLLKYAIGVSKYAKIGGGFQNTQNLLQNLQILSWRLFGACRLGGFCLTLYINLMPPNVGAGPVPARTPERRSSREDIPPNGGSGWHRACPYTGGRSIHTGQTELEELKYSNSIV